MSLDFNLIETKPTRVFNANITHNLYDMFDAAKIASILWEGDNLTSKDVLPELIEAYNDMKHRSEYYKKYEAANGWGTYNGALNFLAEVIKGLKENPEAIIECSR